MDGISMYEMHFIIDKCINHRIPADATITYNDMIVFADALSNDNGRWPLNDDSSPYKEEIIEQRD
jgi:hypothetical protein